MNKQEKLCRILAADSVRTVSDLSSQFFVGPEKVVEYNHKNYSSLHRAVIDKDIYIQDKNLLLEEGNVYEWTTTWVRPSPSSLFPGVHRVVRIARYTFWKHVLDTIGGTILIIPRMLVSFASQIMATFR